MAMWLRLSGLALASAALIASVPSAQAANAWPVPHVELLAKEGLACTGGHEVYVVSADWTGACKDGLPDGHGTLTMVGLMSDVRLTATLDYDHGVAGGHAVIDSTIQNLHTLDRVPEMHFDGMLRDNLPDGPGVLSYASGYRVQGVYKANVLSGKIAIDELDGSHTDGTYVDGRWQYPIVERDVDGSQLTIGAAAPYYHAARVYPDGTTLTVDEGTGTATYRDGAHHAFKGAYTRVVSLAQFRPAPEYPGLSRKLNEVGTVICSAFVAADGTPSRIKVKYSSGYFRLDDAAQAAVVQWRFAPATVGGHAVADWSEVVLQFHLDQPPVAPPPAN
jgi:TonB family protein